jgi:hypothetical protein
MIPTFLIIGVSLAAILSWLSKKDDFDFEPGDEPPPID